MLCNWLNFVDSMLNNIWVFFFFPTNFSILIWDNDIVVYYTRLFIHGYFDCVFDQSCSYWEKPRLTETSLTDPIKTSPTSLAQQGSLPSNHTEPKTLIRKLFNVYCFPKSLKQPNQTKASQTQTSKSHTKP